MKKSLFHLILLMPCLAQGQLSNENIDLQEIIEEIFPFQEGEVELDELFESLLFYYTNPLNLNKAGYQDLLSLYVLTDQQVSNLLKYRQKNGDLISIYELQAIEGFDIVTIRRIVPFVTVEEKPSDTRSFLRRVIEEENNYLILRSERTLEKMEGFKEDSSGNQKFEGDRNKIYARYRVSRSKDFSLGFTMEKDPGESIDFNRSIKRYGADFFSFHFFLENKGNIKQAVLGDYTIQSGQGLLLGAGFNAGKGSETITAIRRSNTGIRPYSSVVESGFFRGLAATYAVGPVDLTAFYSNDLKDASIQIDSVSRNRRLSINSIQESGLHRTVSELANKDRLLEQVYGLSAVYNINQNRFQTGFNVVMTSFSIPVMKQSGLQNRYDFQGSNNRGFGGFANYTWQNFSFFGEAALSRSGGTGMIGGLVGNMGPKLAMSVVMRSYDREFHSFYGSAFSEGSSNINERGIYWGLKLTPVRKLRLTAYYDRFNFPWLKFRIAAPSEGYEYLVRLGFDASRNLKIYGQIRQETKERNTGVGSNLHVVADGRKRNYLVNMDYSALSNIDLRSRLQWSTFTFQKNMTRGFAIIQDINVKLNRFKVGMRFALFDTDDFDNRQYVYERDILYTFSFPAYSGVGVRNYLLLEYKPDRKLTFWLRLARTIREDVERIGSGLNKVAADHRTDLKVQMRYKF